jgi:hypothetical protein
VDTVQCLFEENDELSEGFSNEIMEKAGLISRVFGKLFSVIENYAASHFWEVCDLNMLKYLSKLIDLIPRWDGRYIMGSCGMTPI